jgi:anti-anti-sigma factor
MELGCIVEFGACTAWIELTGELDLATAPVLRGHLREALARVMLVVLDLRRLSFIDAAGLHAIYDASVEAGTHDRRLMLLRGSAQVQRLFMLTGAADKLDIVDGAKHAGSLTPTQAPATARLVMPAVRRTAVAELRGHIRRDVPRPELTA